MTTITHTQQLNAQHDYNRKQVLWLTGMSNEQYCDFIVDTGRAWVDHFWGRVQISNQVLDNNLFWKWWKMQWYIMDDKQILNLLYNYDEDIRHMQYRILHQYVFDLQIPECKAIYEDFKNMLPQFK